MMASLCQTTYFFPQISLAQGGLTHCDESIDLIMSHKI